MFFELIFVDYCGNVYIVNLNSVDDEKMKLAKFSDGWTYFNWICNDIIFFITNIVNKVFSINWLYLYLNYLSIFCIFFIFIVLLDLMISYIFFSSICTDKFKCQYSYVMFWFHFIFLFSFVLTNLNHISITLQHSCNTRVRV
jgi:hypothetical protein